MATGTEAEVWRGCAHDHGRCKHPLLACTAAVQARHRKQPTSTFCSQPQPPFAPPSAHRRPVLGPSGAWPARRQQWPLRQLAAPPRRTGPSPSALRSHTSTRARSCSYAQRWARKPASCGRSAGTCATCGTFPVRPSGSTPACCSSRPSLSVAVRRWRGPGRVAALASRRRRGLQSTC